MARPPRCGCSRMCSRNGPARSWTRSAPTPTSLCTGPGKSTMSDPIAEASVHCVGFACAFTNDLEMEWRRLTGHQRALAGLAVLTRGRRADVAWRLPRAWRTGKYTTTDCPVLNAAWARTPFHLATLAAASL